MVGADARRQLLVVNQGGDGLAEAMRRNLSHAEFDAGGANEGRAAPLDS